MQKVLFWVLLWQRMSGNENMSDVLFFVNFNIKVSDWGRHKRNCMPVMIKDLETKGRGLVASKSFVKGDYILTDKTVVSYQLGEGLVVERRRQFEELMKLVDSLDADERKNYFSLEPNKQFLERIPKDLFPTSKKDYVDAMCIHINNSIEGDVCLTLSLLNHSCDPNSMWCRYLDKSHK